MKCPSCGYRAAEGAGECPRCAEPLVAGEKKKGDNRTATDTLEGVLFLLMGALLLVVFIPLTLSTIDALLALPKPQNLDQVAVVAGSRFYTVPTILLGFSNLMWALAGLFLLLAGFMSMVRGKGRSQAVGAVVLMVFGLFADAFSIIITYSLPMDDPARARDILEILGLDWWAFALQGLVVIATMVLLRLKKRAQKKQQYKKATEKAQALRAARMHAAVQVAAGMPEQPGAAPPPNSMPHPTTPPAPSGQVYSSEISPNDLPQDPV